MGKKRVPIWGEFRMKRDNGSVHISPALYQTKTRPRNQDEAVTKANLVGRNISLLAGYIHQALFQGRAVTPNRRQLYVNGDLKTNGTFRPDHQQVTLGSTVHTEIKAFAGRNTRAHCGGRQFWQYSHALLKSLDGGEEDPEFKYALYRYGAWNPEFKITRMRNPEFVQVMSKQFRDAVIYPSNLGILLFLATSAEVRDQSNHSPGSSEVLYWRVQGTHRSMLMSGSPKESIEKIMAHVRKTRGVDPFEDITPKDLMLDDLVVERYTPTQRLYFDVKGRTYRIAPPAITLFRNKSPGKWARRLRRDFARYEETFGGDTSGMREYDPNADGDTSFDPPTLR